MTYFLYYKDKCVLIGLGVPDISCHHGLIIRSSLWGPQSARSFKVSETWLSDLYGENEKEEHLP